jgi:hypothetical protein
MGHHFVRTSVGRAAITPDHSIAERKGERREGL